MSPSVPHGAARWALAFVLHATAACSSSDREPVSPPQVTRHCTNQGCSGSWVGTTGEGAGIEFTITGESVTRMSVSYSIEGSNCGHVSAVTFAVSPPVPVVADSFVVEGEIPQPGLYDESFAVFGRFTSRQQSSGSVIAYWGACGVGHTTWTATR